MSHAAAYADNHDARDECTRTAALAVPCLPQTAPEAPTPRDMALPLMAHQRRALHRCLLIERDGSLSTDFNALPAGYGQYTSRGGVLADAVGTGKTATSIALVLASADEPGGGGDTLVVAPGHLIHQWRGEVERFAPGVEVLMGKAEFDAAPRLYRTEARRRIVLVDVADVLGEERVWYDFRRIFTDASKRCEIRTAHGQMETYRAAARSCVASPLGPCSYEGWLYRSTLHNPPRPWRRVIFDEVQDLVRDGAQSQKNLIQLSRTARHVWLLSATPFPHGNKSVRANHELLGFCRLRLDVEVDWPLPGGHPFEVIKRKLYIRSPKTVADEAVAAGRDVVRVTVHTVQQEVERQFYEMELEKVGGACVAGGGGDAALFGTTFRTLREMTVHPEASSEIRSRASSSSDGGGPNSDRLGMHSSLTSFARVSLHHAKRRSRELKALLRTKEAELRHTEKSLEVALKVKAHRELPLAANPFAAAAKGGGDGTDDDADAAERGVIHASFCECSRPGGVRCKSDEKAVLRVIQENAWDPEFIRGRGSSDAIYTYFGTNCHAAKVVRHVPALEHYINVTERAVTSKRDRLEELRTEQSQVTTRVRVLSSSSSAPSGARGKPPSASDDKDDDDAMAAAHGSKQAALVRHLRQLRRTGEKAIVFSMWHDTLRLVQGTLRKCGIPCTFCDGDGESMRRSLASFTSGDDPGGVNVLLLSAQAKASGANLQCATHVVLLDPPGLSAEHGAALEQQAIGRAVRMGQDSPVTVTRFEVLGTVEGRLFGLIDRAAAEAADRANDASYVCEGAGKTLPGGLGTGGGTNDYSGGADDGVTVTASVSATETLQQRFDKAKERGMVINITDSDSEDDDETGKGDGEAVNLLQSKDKSMSVTMSKVVTDIQSDSTSPAAPKSAGERSDVIDPHLPDDLEVFVPFVHRDKLLFTTDKGGSTVFCAYHGPTKLNNIRSGDIIVSVNGICTTKKTLGEVKGVVASCNDRENSQNFCIRYRKCRTHGNSTPKDKTDVPDTLLRPSSRTTDASTCNVASTEEVVLRSASRGAEENGAIESETIVADQLSSSTLKRDTTCEMDGPMDEMNHTKPCDAHLSGEYEARIPFTLEGLLLSIGDVDDKAVFCKYRRFKDGTKGPAEVGKLIRATGDFIVAINGASTSGKTLGEIGGMIKDSMKSNKFVCCIRFRPGSCQPVPSDCVHPVGTVVRVASRTGKGINKPGGVARVTAIVRSTKSPLVSYDVAYVMGGREKGVAQAFLSLEAVTEEMSMPGGRRTRRSTRKNVECTAHDFSASPNAKKRKMPQTEGEAAPEPVLPDRSPEKRSRGDRRSLSVSKTVAGTEVPMVRNHADATPTESSVVSPEPEPMSDASSDNGECKPPEDRGPTNVKQLLALCNLESYFETFEAQGYSDFEVLVEKSSDVLYLEKLVEDVQFPAGYAIRFLNMLSRQAIAK